MLIFLKRHYITLIITLLLPFLSTTASAANENKEGGNIQIIGAPKPAAKSVIDLKATPAQQVTLLKNDVEIKKGFEELHKIRIRIQNLTDEWEYQLKNFDKLALCGALENVRANIKNPKHINTDDGKKALEAYVLLETQFKKDIDAKNVTCAR